MPAYDLTPAQVSYLKKNFEKLTHRQLYDKLVPDASVKYTTFRTAMYKHGFKRFTPQKWTAAEVKCLKDNLNHMGNAQLAAHISKTCGRKFKEKQIDKKLTLLKLTRTEEGFKKVKQNYVDAGVYTEANRAIWKDRVSPEGATRIWRDRKFIKVNGTFIPAAPHYWKMKHGEVPDGHVVWHIDQDSKNSSPDCHNLEVITREEAAKRIAAINKSRPESLKKSIKLYNKLTKAIKNEQSE
jgi:hypothetical protein